MKFDRRELFLGMPAGLAGLAFCPPASAQSESVSNVDPAALNFWVNRMGVPAELLSPPGDPRAVATRLSGWTQDPSQESDLEPFFFYYDEEADGGAGKLVPATSLKPEHLDKQKERGSDTKVTLTKNRLRFGDHHKSLFEKYTSGGIYLETQQHPSAPSVDYGALGWSTLTAILQTTIS